MFPENFCFLLLITGGSCFYQNYDNISASEAVRQLYEEKYNMYYKSPEDYSDDELIDLIEESLTAFVEMLSEKSHVNKFLKDELKKSNRAFLIFINKLFLAVTGKGDDDPLELVKDFVKEHYGEIKEVFPNIKDFFNLVQDLIFTEEESRRKRDLEDQWKPSSTKSLKLNNEYSEIDYSMTPDEVLEKVEWLKTKKPLFSKKTDMAKFQKSVSKYTKSEKYQPEANDYEKPTNKKELIKETIGGFTQTISYLLEDLATSRDNVEAEKIRRVQKKFNNLSKYLNKELSG